MSDTALSVFLPTVSHRKQASWCAGAKLVSSRNFLSETNLADVPRRECRDSSSHIRMEFQQSENLPNASDGHDRPLR